MAKNIMLAFVSPVLDRSLSNPINYPDVQGRAYTAIQTNELEKIFLIASDSVKNGKVQLENEFGDVTHLEFLRRRIAKEFPQLTERFSIQDYSEDGTGSTKLEMNILQTARIADAVTAFGNRHANEKIIVHADMTGGFRHTSMLMLSIIQLLKYRGVEIGEVLYSDPTSRVVYRVTEIQRMFSLITGADEFVKFGSVEALNEYFGENPPPAVKNLLEAMNRFSEAIKICRTSAIEYELKNLGQHIKTFREHPDKDLKSALFAKIIDTVESGYGDLIGESVERTEIIRWCMRKGFWQQAMTLCSEWLPLELVDRKICAPRDSVIKNEAESKARSQRKTWQQYFITDYRIAVDAATALAAEKEFCNEIREVLENFPAKKLDDENNFGELKNFLNAFDASRIPFEDCQRGTILVNAFKKKCPVLADALQVIYDERRSSPIYRKNFYQFLQTVDYAKIPKLIAKLSVDKIFILFKIERNKSSNKESAEKIERTWENREKEYRRMFAKKVMFSVLDIKVALKFLSGYHAIRYERNQVNHANAQASKTISELKPMIENYLAELEKIPANKKIAATLSRNG